MFSKQSINCEHCVGLARRVLCENKRAKIKFIDSTRRDRSVAVGIVEILEANLERMELSQSFGCAVN